MNYVAIFKLALCLANTAVYKKLFLGPSQRLLSDPRLAMSLDDLPEGAHAIQSGAAHAGVANSTPSAFKDAAMSVPVVDVPIDTPMHYDSDIRGEKASLASEAPTSSQTKFLNGEPIIVTGEDISNYVVDDRDDGDPALTFRSFVLGTIIAGLGATLAQVEAFSLCP
jgi:hypothetical protein